ncbi:MAG: MBL fold metallo-hydrolase [Promethearchaeota archaeon]
MTAVREQGRINENTYLIDTKLFGVGGTLAVYLVKATKSCLIDCGGQTEVKRIVKTLKDIEVFPPDYVILTHSHWDHSQGVPLMREIAQKENKHFEVLASEKAIPLLEDQSFNEVFHPKKPLINIKDVTPLKESDIIDLEGLELKIIDVPGHSKDHIAIRDEKNKNLFVGDAIGSSFGEKAFLAPFMPPFWNKDDYYSSMDKLRQTEFEGICLGHFGYIYGQEAKNLVNEARNLTDQWWQIFESVEAENKLDDMNYLLNLIIQETNEVIPDFKVEKLSMKIGLGLMNGIRKITRKEPLVVGRILLLEVLPWLVKGYKISK